jgi:methyl-accepting chemotaxis protein
MMICLILIGGSSIYSINKINQDAVLIGSGIDGLSQIAASRNSIYESLVDLKSAFAESSDSRRSNMISSERSKIDNALKLWKQYDPSCDPGDERAGADKVNLKWKTYFEALDNLEKSASSNVDSDLIKKTLDIGYDLANSMQFNVDYQTNQASDAVKTATSFSSLYTYIMAITVLLMLLIASVACVMLMRAVVKPIKLLSDIMERLAENHTDVLVPGIERKDELGIMARNVEVFKKNSICSTRHLSV